MRSSVPRLSLTQISLHSCRFVARFSDSLHGGVARVQAMDRLGASPQDLNRAGRQLPRSRKRSFFAHRSFRYSILMYTNSQHGTHAAMIYASRLDLIRHLRERTARIAVPVRPGRAVAAGGE